MVIVDKIMLSVWGLSLVWDKAYKGNWHTDKVRFYWNNSPDFRVGPGSLIIYMLDLFE